MLVRDTRPCAHIRIYIYTYIYIHTYVYVYIFIYIFIFIGVCVNYMIFFTLVVQREKKDGAEAGARGRREGVGTGGNRISHTFTLSLCRTASLRGIFLGT